MGGFGENAAAAGGDSAPAAPAQSTGGAASSGISAGGILSGIGVGLTGYELMKSHRDSKKQQKELRRLQLLNTQRKKNLLEERLAARRARIGSLGISSDGSVAASKQSLIQNTMDDIAEDDLAYSSQYDEISDNYRKKLRQTLLNEGSDLAGKVIK